MKQIVLALVLLVVTAFAAADLPVHCLYHQIQGEWQLQLTKNGQTKDVVNTCTLESSIQTVSTINVKLDGPDVVRDAVSGENIGRFTLIYDQGMELFFGNNKYFAFFNYTKQGDKVISNCDRTFTGWYHDDMVNSNNWGCFRAQKVNTNTLIETVNVHTVKSNPMTLTKRFYQSAAVVNKLNSMNLGWTSKVYPQFQGKTMAEMQRIAGKKVEPFRKKALKATQNLFKSLGRMQGRNKPLSTAELPKNFDWRNVSGVNYVSPVRDQGNCGSCYAFATMAMFEARVRIASKNQETPVFSPQDVVQCCGYSQGCDGGFPYLVAKYAEDFGLTAESCDPYTGVDGKCYNKCPAGTTRQYATKHHYVGGYYGGTTAENMQLELYNNGPIAIGFEVVNAFFGYSGGVFKCDPSLKEVSPDPHFEETNHAVLITGYGETEAGEKYWIVKNSWGENWGMDGYFMIERGTDTCDVESLAVAAIPYAIA